MKSSGVLADRPRQNCDGGGAGQIAPLARSDGLTVQGPTVRLCCRGVTGRAREGPFACGVPGAVRGTWALSRGLDVDERPVSRERLLRRDAHSRQA